jgi:hypothetical protein
VVDAVPDAPLPVVPFFVANLIPAFLDVPLRALRDLDLLRHHAGRRGLHLRRRGLGEVFARGETPDLGIIFEPHILLPILGLAALAVLPILIKALRGKQGL